MSAGHGKVYAVTHVDLRPDRVRLVEVLADDGQWHVGELMAYRLEDGVWSGWVHWTAGVGETYVGWLSQESLAPYDVPVHLTKAVPSATSHSPDVWLTVASLGM